MASPLANDPVLVIGAGPVGLTMACELIRHGVPCRIVDPKSGPTSESRVLSACTPARSKSSTRWASSDRCSRRDGRSTG